MSNIDKDVNVAEDKPREEHSKLPWVLSEVNYDYDITSADGSVVMVDTAYYPIAPSRTDADFIVKAVNLHGELVEALERVLSVSRGVSGRLILEAEDEASARTVLEKARG